MAGMNARYLGGAALFALACSSASTGGNTDAAVADARVRSLADGGALSDAAGQASPDGAANPTFDAALGLADAARAVDAAVSPADAARPSPDAPMPAADAAPDRAEHVHILIDNFCNVAVDPESYTVARGQTLQLTYHNHSVDYEADVWLSYGGGFLGLPTGGVWEDRFQFCSGPRPYDAAADISIAGGPSRSCPGVRLLIHCN